MNQRFSNHKSHRKKIKMKLNKSNNIIFLALSLSTTTYILPYLKYVFLPPPKFKRPQIYFFRFFYVYFYCFLVLAINFFIYFHSLLINVIDIFFNLYWFQMEKILSNLKILYFSIVRINLRSTQLLII